MSRLKRRNELGFNTQMSAPVPTTAVAAAFARIIAGMGRALSVRFMRNQEAAPLVSLIYVRLTRLAARFAGLAARAEAGTLPARRVRAASDPQQAPPHGKRAARELPGGFAWLCRMVQDCASFGRQIEYLVLHDPQMRALIAAAPQVGRVLRPLLRMTGVAAMPEILRLPRRKRRAAGKRAAGKRAKTAAKAKAAARCGIGGTLLASRRPGSGCKETRRQRASFRASDNPPRSIPSPASSRNPSAAGRTDPPAGCGPRRGPRWCGSTGGG